MKNLLLSSTRFESRCRKAFLLMVALGLAALCTLFTPADAQVAPGVQAMVKNQPFPYLTGVAMDTLLYSSVKGKLLAADRLRIASKAAIDSLQREISLTRKALDDQARLGQYNAGQNSALIVQMNVQQGLLATAQGNMVIAERAVANVLAVLPRQIRRELKTAPADQVATATVEYIHLLQQRKWKWAGLAGGGGFLLGLALLL